MATGDLSIRSSSSRLPAALEPALAGVRGIAPALLALVPLGLTLGATIAASPIHDGVGWVGAALVYGGSSHLTAISLLGAGASGFAVVLAVWLVSARGIVYSAGILPRMEGQPAWFRWTAPYLLVDPLYALVTSPHGQDAPAWWVRWHYLGAGLAIWLMWLPTVAVGILAGPLLPDHAGIHFALPALLIAFLVPGVRSRPAVVAAVTGGLAGGMAAGLPSGLGLLVGVAVGTAAAVAFERRMS